MARNRSAGTSSRKIRFDRSRTAPPPTQPRRPARKPAAMSRTTGKSDERTDEFIGGEHTGPLRPGGGRRAAPRRRASPSGGGEAHEVASRGASGFQKVARRPTFKVRPGNGASG